MRTLKFHPCGNFRTSYGEELRIFETDFGRLWLVIGLVLLFGVVPFISPPYLLYVINTMGVFAITAVGLNLLTGYTGQISLGHGAFFGVGAYSAAILASKCGWPFILVLPASGVITAAVGSIFGIPSSRLKHLYLLIATLAGQFIIEYVLLEWESLTGGMYGIIIMGASLFGLELTSDMNFYFVIFACFVILTWIASNLVRTRYGRAFVAIRDNDRAAEGMGIPVFPYKLLSFAISSFYAGIGGALFAYYTMSITPEPFNLWLSIELVAMIIVGGLGSIPGSVFGTVFLVGLSEVLTHLTEYLMNVGATGVAITLAPLREVIYGLVIVLFLVFEPKGIAEVWRVIKASFRLWPFSY